jgi:hypothetical protein
MGIPHFNDSPADDFDDLQNLSLGAATPHITTWSRDRLLRLFAYTPGIGQLVSFFDVSSHPFDK